MNEVFLIGKITEKIEYKFMLKNKKYAKAKLKLELLDKTRLEVIVYNEIADYALQNINENEMVFINARICTNEIEGNYIEKL